MGKIKNKITDLKIETLLMIVLVTIVIVIGIFFFTLTTQNKKMNNFKDDANFLIKVAKNSYASFTKSNKVSNIITSTSGDTKGMCITIDGLKKNDFLTKEYKDWDGYIVIEENSTGELYYSIWATDKNYSIEGYSENKIKDLTLDNGLTKYNKEEFTSKVEKYFTGTSGEKGGTGTTDGSNLKKYNSSCINEKVE